MFFRKSDAFALIIGESVGFLVQKNGKILVSSLRFVGAGQTNYYLTRLNPDGTLDNGFNVAINGSVSKMLEQSDGKILLVGYFTSVNGQSRLGVARLSTLNKLDGYNPNPGLIITVSIQTDGMILVGGGLFNVRMQTRVGLARLYPNITAFDFDTDGKADVSVFRPENSNWYIQQSPTRFFCTGQNAITRVLSAS